MIALLGVGGEIVYEIIKFLIMIVLIVCGVKIGKKLRDYTDAKKAAKLAFEESATHIEANTISIDADQTETK